MSSSGVGVRAQFYCVRCTAPAGQIVSSLVEGQYLGTCERYPEAHRNVPVAVTLAEAQRIRAERLTIEQTAQHKRHVASGGVSGYCEACTPARGHTMHRRYRKPNPACHVCRIEFRAQLQTA